jgi:hypothetical protein
MGETRSVSNLGVFFSESQRTFKGASWHGMACSLALAPMLCQQLVSNWYRGRRWALDGRIHLGDSQKAKSPQEYSLTCPQSLKFCWCGSSPRVFFHSCFHLKVKTHNPNSRAGPIMTYCLGYEEQKLYTHESFLWRKSRSTCARRSEIWPTEDMLARPCRPLRIRKERAEQAKKLQ